MADSDDPINGSFHKRLKCRPMVRSYLLIYVGLTRCYLRVGWGMKVLTLGVGWSEGGRFLGGGVWLGESYEFSQLSAALRLLPLVLIWQRRGRGCKPAGLNPTAEPLTPTSIRARLPWQGSQSQTLGGGAWKLSDRWERFHTCLMEYKPMVIMF